MDIIAEIGKSKLYTFHSHTQFCDGHAPMETMARAAVSEGFTHYGFSPHSPVPIASPCNMKAEDTDAYLAEVERIKGLFGDRCRFYAGMEIDYLGPEWGPAHPYFREQPLDFRIGSVHFIPTQDGVPTDIDGHFERFSERVQADFHGDIDYVVDTFFGQSLAMVEAGGFDIIGHLDKVGLNASLYAPGIEGSSFYQSRLNRLLDAVAEAGVIVELNTKAFEEHGRMFPAAASLRKLMERGTKVIVNSDAHRPERVNASRLQGLAMVEKIKGSLGR
ncbi:MAG: histidinol-phosphatase [Muribaculaceae bacterium]|nr:histidinol-phosphatase [Muribaculaceae bacterium]